MILAGSPSGAFRALARRVLLSCVKERCQLRLGTLRISLNEAGLARGAQNKACDCAGAGTRRPELSLEISNALLLAAKEVEKEKKMQTLTSNECCKY